jgi:hypothetical protein
MVSGMRKTWQMRHPMGVIMPISLQPRSRCLKKMSLATLQFILMAAKLGNNFNKRLFHIKFG